MVEPSRTLDHIGTSGIAMPLWNKHYKTGTPTLARRRQSWAGFTKSLFGVASATPHKLFAPSRPIFEDSEGSKYAAVYLLPSDAEYMLVIYCQTCGEFSAGFVMFVP